MEMEKYKKKFLKVKKIAWRDTKKIIKKLAKKGTQRAEL